MVCTEKPTMNLCLKRLVESWPGKRNWLLGAGNWMKGGERERERGRILNAILSPPEWICIKTGSSFEPFCCFHFVNWGWRNHCTMSMLTTPFQEKGGSRHTQTWVNLLFSWVPLSWTKLVYTHIQDTALFSLIFFMMWCWIYSKLFPAVRCVMAKSQSDKRLHQVPPTYQIQANI